MQFAKVNYSSLETISKRLDSEFYQIQPLVSRIASLDSKILSALTSWVTQGPNPKFVEEDIPCLTGRNIANGEVTFENTDQVDEQEYQSLARFKLKDNDVLITLKGAGSTGKVALFKSDKKAIFSRNLGLIRLNTSETTAELLFAFLSSNFGQKIIDRGVTGGTGQLTLPTSYLKQISIPLFSRRLTESITSIVKKSLSSQTEALVNYEYAEKILLSELNLLGYKPKHQLSFVKNFSDTQSADRIDAEYYQPKFEEIVDKVKKYKGGYVLLSEVAKTKRGSLIPDVFYCKKEETAYIRGADFSNGFLKGDKIVYVDSSFSNKNETRVKNKEIVFALIGSVGSTALVEQEYNGSFISNNIGKISVKNYNSTVLQVLLHSIIGEAYFEKVQTQTAQPKISDKDIHNFILPKFEKIKIKQIETLYQRSREENYFSKKLLDIAKQGIEMAIEKDETQAQKWIDEKLQEMNIALQTAD